MPPPDTLEVLANPGPGAAPIRSTCLSATNGIHVLIASQGTTPSGVPDPERMQRFTMNAAPIPEHLLKTTSMAECTKKLASSIEDEVHS